MVLGPPPDGLEIFPVTQLAPESTIPEVKFTRPVLIVPTPLPTANSRVLLPPPQSTMPLNTAPGFTISRSLSPPNAIAVPLDPVMVPALVTVIGAVVAAAKLYPWGGIGGATPA